MNKIFPKPQRNSDAYLRSVAESQSLQSRVCRWTGVKDFRNAWKDYQRKDYESALKNGALGSLKLGIIAAACYGAYKYATGDVIHINDFATQAENDLHAWGHRSFVPVSAEKFINSMYEEQKVFAKWPKSGQKFAAQRLQEDAPMSSAIVGHLFKEAALREDGTFERWAIKACREAKSTSNSCLAMAESYAGASHPSGLSNAMRLVNRCRKTSNAFCERVLESAKILSIAQKSISDINSLAELLTNPKTKIDLGKSRGFVESAASLFDQEISDLQMAIDDCDRMQAGDLAAGEVCYKRASGFETVAAWGSWLVGKDQTDAWRKNYGMGQANLLQGELKDALIGFIRFSKVCSKIPTSQPCQQHVDRSIAMFDVYQKALKNSVNDCNNVNVHDSESDSWKRCYSHATMWEFEMGDLSRWKKNWYAEKKSRELTEELKNSVSMLGLGLAESCKNAPSQSCQEFSGKIVSQLLYDCNLPDAASKLMINSKVAIGPVLADLAKNNKWEHGINLILSFAKRNPSFDIEGEVRSFWNGLMHSSKACRAFELLSVSDQLDIEKTLVKVFEKEDEDHLYRIYLLAKSWIAKKDNKYNEHLKFIIKEFFKLGKLRMSSGYLTKSLEDVMAKALVTKWMESTDPTSLNFRELEDYWGLQKRAGSEFDRYSHAITDQNWENRLNAVLSPSASPP